MSDRSILKDEKDGKNRETPVMSAPGLDTEVKSHTEDGSEASPQQEAAVSIRYPNRAEYTTSDAQTTQTHTSWRPTYGKVQKCDYCDLRSKDGVLQRCNSCSVKICRQCVNAGKLAPGGRHSSETHRLEADDSDIDWSPKSRQSTKSDSTKSNSSEKPKRRHNIDELLRESQARAASRAASRVTVRARETPAERNPRRSSSLYDGDGGGDEDKATPGPEDTAAAARPVQGAAVEAAKRSRRFIDEVDDEEGEDGDYASPGKKMRYEVPAANHPSQQFPKQDADISRHDSRQNVLLSSAPSHGHGCMPCPPHHGFHFSQHGAPQWPHHPQDHPRPRYFPPPNSSQHHRHPQSSNHQAPWQGPLRPTHPARPSPSLAPPPMAANRQARSMPPAVAPPARPLAVDQVRSVYQQVFWGDQPPTFTSIEPGEIPQSWLSWMLDTQQLRPPEITEQQHRDDLGLMNNMSDVWAVYWAEFPEIRSLCSRPTATDVERRANRQEALNLLWNVFKARTRSLGTPIYPATVRFFVLERDRIRGAGRGSPVTATEDR
ncbi:hypothetical protein B0H67DRAFT_37095 [Lasiosphaeris hirsuta]|uniref:Uncharacterized protein n=1 Tax=Lasiosphaeris hirsuta TaxID=260670 RepID=A0AA40BAB0_9PEZI|nr:hypothetical protein B0H67DRAFT_37095 [Lasiosphaeris hirsuta]